MTKRICAALAAASTLALATPAWAGSSEGKLQIKAFATGVLPNGEITEVKTNLIGAPATSDSQASDSVVPTLAVEYFFSPNLSVETICCVTPHDVTGKGGLAGAALVNDAIILPATVTLKYHFDLGVVKPYIGAGPAHFFIFSEGVGSTARTLGATDVNLKDDFGIALQAGADVKLVITARGADAATQSFWGRPAYMMQMADGSVLVSDEQLGAIYRITYQR